MLEWASVSIVMLQGIVATLVDFRVGPDATARGANGARSIYQGIDGVRASAGSAQRSLGTSGDHSGRSGSWSYG